MTRKQRISILKEDTHGLDISSLMGVCFLLLIYFIVTTTIQASEQYVEMRVPTPEVSPPSLQKLAPLLIKVDSSGVIYTGVGESQEQLDSNPKSRNVPLLMQRVSMYKNLSDLTGGTPVAKLVIDGDAEQQRALDVFNALAKSNIKHVTLNDIEE